MRFLLAGFTFGFGCATIFDMKRLLAIIFCFCSVFVFAACDGNLMTFGGSNTVNTVNNQVPATASFIKSTDGGKTWSNKITINETQNIGTADILSIAISSQNSQVIYIGTANAGLYVTKNGADNWEKLNFPLTKIYGLALDSKNDQTVYASGALGKRAKIYKSTDGGQNWTEIYTEPADNTVITSLAASSNDANIVYAGTDQGVIIKTIDGGQSWRSIFRANGPVTSISFDSASDQIVYFGVFEGIILRTMNSGERIEDLNQLSSADNNFIGENFGSGNGRLGSNVYSVAVDPRAGGVLYAGTGNGLLKGTGYGRNWEEVGILESSRKFPIRAEAVNPKNSSEIIYSSSGAIYKSTNRGLDWFTFQLNTDKVANVIKYDPNDSNVIYMGLRSL